MTIFQAILLGVVQGVTEFLPVSSSAHLILVPQLLGWEDQGLDFDVMVHIATLLAIIWVLKDDIWGMLSSMLSKRADDTGMLGWKIVLATLPIAFAGLLITDNFLSIIRTTQVVGIALIFWGVVLFFADRYAKKNARAIRSVEKTGWRAAILVGFFQIMALIPGTSRSGATMTGALFAGLDRKTAAKFSFLLAIPAISGAGIFIALDAVQTGFDTPAIPLLFGFISAFISGIIAIRFLLSFLERASFAPFAIYRILLGVIILAIAWL